MDAVNVARVFAPNILKPDNDQLAIAMEIIPKVSVILETLILHHDMIFKELDVQYRVSKESERSLFVISNPKNNQSW